MKKVQARVAAAFAAVALAVVPAAAAQAAGAKQVPAAQVILARVGSRGPLVREVQRVVHVRVDGVYGPGTARAVAAWQRAHHLPATGTVDKVTYARMHPAPRPKPQPTPTALPYIAPTVTYIGMTCEKHATGTTLVWHWKLTGGQYSLITAIDPSGGGPAKITRVYGTTLTRTSTTTTNWDGVSDWGDWTQTPWYGFWTEPIGHETPQAGHAVQGTAAPVVPKC